MIRNSKSLFSFLHKNSTVNFKKYSYIFNGEFENYYFVNANSNFFKFFIIFLYELFFQTDYKLNFSSKTSIRKYKWVFVKTGEYIYVDNLIPIIDCLEKNNDNTLTISLSKTRYFNFFNFFNFKVFKKYTSLSILKSLSIYEWHIGLYVELVIIPKIEKILDCIKNLDNQVFISADPADLFSRCISYNISKKNQKFIMIQSGPVASNNPEWESIKPDLLVSWPYFDNFFKKENIISKPFFPPRFYYTKRESDYKKDLDLVIFLPWLQKNKRGRKILKEINRILIECEKSCENLIYIKYHPAGELDLKLSKKFVMINSKKSAKKVLMRSKKILNFGSTVSFDCKYLNVCCGIVNTSNHLPKDSPYLSLKHSTLISSLDDLKMFLQLETCVTDHKKFDNNDLIFYLQNNFFNEKRK